MRSSSRQGYTKFIIHDLIVCGLEIGDKDLKIFVTGQKKVVWPPVPETNGYHQQPQV